MTYPQILQTRTLRSLMRAVVDSGPGYITTEDASVRVSVLADIRVGGDHNIEKKRARETLQWLEKNGMVKSTEKDGRQLWSPVRRGESN